VAAVLLGSLSEHNNLKSERSTVKIII